MHTDSSSFKKKLDRNITDSPEAPEFYTRLAVTAFSFFFGLLFGSIMLAVNIRKTEKSKLAWEAVALGFVLTGLQYWISFQVPSVMGLSIVLSLLGAWFLSSVIWNYFISPDTEYRKRSIAVPLVIGISMYILFFLWVIIGLSGLFF